MNTFITWINHLLTFSSAKLSACQVLSTWQIQTRFWCRKLVSYNVCNRHVWHFSSVRLSSLAIFEIIHLKRKWHYFRVTEFHNKWECSLIKFDYTCPWNPLALLCESLRCTVVIRIIRPCPERTMLAGLEIKTFFQGAQFYRQMLPEGVVYRNQYIFGLPAEIWGSRRRNQGSPGKGFAPPNLKLWLDEPKTRLKFGDCAFSISAPRLWKALPQHLKDSTSCQAFKKCLKTHLFRLAHWGVVDYDSNYDNVQRFWTFSEWKWRYINSNYYLLLLLKSLHQNL